MKCLNATLSNTNCINKEMEISFNTEFYRKSVKRLIGMGWQHIENDFGGGTCENLLKLYDDYFNAMDESNLCGTEERNWRLDLAKNNVYQELHRGLRIG